GQAVKLSRQSLLVCAFVCTSLLRRLAQTHLPAERAENVRVQFLDAVERVFTSPLIWYLRPNIRLERGKIFPGKCLLSHTIPEDSSQLTFIACVPHYRVTHIRAIKCRFLKIRALKLRTCERGALKLHAGKPRALKLCTCEGGALKLRAL